MIEWRAELNPWLAALLVIGVAISIPLLYARLQQRLTAAQAGWILLPRCGVLVLLTIALFEPVIRHAAIRPASGIVRILLDVSASMDVRDNAERSRAERARMALTTISRALPRNVTTELWAFDIEPRRIPDSAEPPLLHAQSTDIGASLAALALWRNLPPASCLVLLTDGGDEPAPPEILPDMPIFALGFGTDPAGWNDVAIANIEAPVTVEKGVAFELACDLRAHAQPGSAFAVSLNNIRVILERRQNDSWMFLHEQTESLAHGSLRIVFKQTSDEAGLQDYRVRVTPLVDEVSALNNTRHLTIETRLKSVRVLYFTRELGADFRALRHALAQDPGVAFTALYRTDSERFTLQGERLDGDSGMTAGFPDNPELLKPYDCILVGSFPASDWTSKQALALVNYVEKGGAVAFIGGEHAFAGEYSLSPITDLFPWSLPNNTGDLLLGTFPVRIAPGANHHPISAGLESLASEPGAIVESLNSIGSLKPGAERILVATSETGEAPLVAIHSVGRGKALALASNTFWKWIQKSDALRNAHDRFWRQVVRALTDAGEGSVLFVEWDREQYGAGDTAHANIRVSPPPGSAPVSLRASIKIDGKTEPVALSTTPEGRHSTAMPMPRRGEYCFELIALMNGSVIETYEKIFRTGALLDEGAHLEVNAQMLQRLAEHSGGAYLPETEVSELAGKIAGRFVETQSVIEQPLVNKWHWFLPAILTLLLTEWFLRRRRNMI